MEIPKIDGFEILEKLGEGGMASVWKARQISLDRIVAIKILSPHLAAAAEDVSRFLKEACATAQLKHQGIVQVYDAKASGDLYCFVMEYVAGYTVGDWVRRKGSLSENDTLTVIDCIADAMDYAWHTTRVVHCDIKPDNIIIDADGTVKVADLGLSHTINAINIDTECDEVMGTPAYISPEQAEGKSDIDCRSDIYSLGAMMYHMLTGKLMFQGETDEKVMEMQVSKNPIDAQKINPAISSPVNNLLKKMLQKKRSERPQDWAQVRRQLFQVRSEVAGKYGVNGTVSVSAAVTGGLSQYEQRDSRYRSEKTKNLLLIRTVALFVGFAILAIITSKACRRTTDKIEEVPVVVRPVPAVIVNSEVSQSKEDVEVESRPIPVDDNAREMFEFAKDQQRTYPAKISESIQAFKKVAVQTRGTKYSLMAEDEVKRLQIKLKEQMNLVMLDLDKQAKDYVDAGELLAAANVYEMYSGVQQVETSEFRENAARLLRAQNVKRNQALQLSRQKKRTVIKKLVNKLPEVILDEGIGSANILLKKAMNDPMLASYIDKLNNYSAMLTKAENIDTYILDSYRDQIGKEVTVNIGQGNIELVITTVDNYYIVGRQDINVGSGIASSEIVFSVSDLTPRERMSRMGDDDADYVALVKGVMAYESKAYGHAYRFFESIDGQLSAGLLAQVDMQIKAQIEQDACDNLRFLLSAVGVDIPIIFDMQSWKNALVDVSIDKNDISKLTRIMETYMSEYGDTKFVDSALPIINDLKWILERSAKAAQRSFITEEDEPVEDNIKINRSDLDLGWRKNRQKKINSE